MDLKKTGNLLKELRKENKLTQEQLAEKLNVSGRTVSRWETGSNLPDLDILIELADYAEIEKKRLAKKMCDMTAGAAVLLFRNYG